MTSIKGDNPSFQEGAQCAMCFQLNIIMNSNPISVSSYFLFNQLVYKSVNWQSSQNMKIIETELVHSAHYCTQQERGGGEG